MSSQIIKDPVSGELKCKCFKRCGGCQLSETYSEQIQRKQDKAERMLSRYAKVQPIIAMDSPYHYRNKVQNMYGFDSSKRIISGIFQSSSRKLVAVDDCMLEDSAAAPIVAELKKLMKSFKIFPYDHNSGRGFLRHTLIRHSLSTGEIMLVLVTATPVFPAKKNFVKAMLSACPQITTIVRNVCTNKLPLTMGERDIVMHGKGFIEDELCGCRFRISPRSFYQVNSLQTEKLYTCAVEAADIGKGTKVIDAYCGTGTIGMICAKRGADVTGTELNPAAVRDAVANAKLNGLDNIRFCNEDAGDFMQRLAAEGESCDVLILDPPRAGASAEFITAAGKLAPEKIVYVSCKIETLERDLRLFKKEGYRARYIQPVDMFPHTTGIETVVLLSRKTSGK
ncbi:23S rRNA (uracil1939-C5)-methyltransferase [Ruminococcus sp. YE71]|uniref:23S rRNA (uracil(1939)-C(5))-methyltransferase RlmD n=1 Tax=unclassified Ruminococcus TaxID=2608920 RepID=UPI000890612E|nr:MULTISPECIES: 23S rRNA (uracil(1939)-C(5))-methyltransferase RlmD [unclassified Ruminococcus]SDA19874.1 23S rRNA (uracil1939-C5)-methyltransferase [Ruminococcus sp. YE78]SFW31497.1 23S rRNA (uracil1939-C5)-methyltransferase [Ruminococcus sp. YE71]